MLANPGFEGGIDGWQTLNSQLAESTTPHSGSRALQVSTTGYEQSASVWQWLAVPSGSTYEFSAWVLVDQPAVDRAFLRIAWFDASGSLLLQEDSAWLTGMSPAYRQVSTGSRQSPGAATSVRPAIVIMSSGPFSALIDDAALSATPPSPPPATPAPTNGTAPSSSATPQATQPTPTPRTPAPTPTAAAVVEPDVFPNLTNGGFEMTRGDATAYGWRKVGGQASTTTRARVGGERSFEISSETSSTKWVHQTVLVRAGNWYEASAWALTDDPAAELFIRLSWYASADGSGQAISSSDSSVVVGAQHFRHLSTGPTQAPAGASTVKVRLLLRPGSAAAARALFDEVALGDSVPSELPEDSIPPGSRSTRQSGSPRVSSVASRPHSAPGNDATPGSPGNAAIANIRAPVGEPEHAAPLHGKSGGMSPWEAIAGFAVLASLAGMAAVFAGELTRRDGP